MVAAGNILRRQRMEKLVLIDGHSIINRAFYGVPELTNSEGLHTNGCLLYTSSSGVI